MAHRYDVSLKTLFLRDGDGIIRRRLFGARVTEFLATEQPQMSNRRADMVVRTEDGALHQVEFQTANESGFALRMLEYYVYLVRTHKQHVVQTVLYLGREPVRLEHIYQSPSMEFRFEIVNLREIDAEPLLASLDWADNILALLAKGAPEKALATVMMRIREMRREDQNWAAGTLLQLSGILGMEEVVNEGLRELGMINLMENKVLAPLILEQYEAGRSKGLQEGLREGLQEGLREGLQEGLREGRQNLLAELLTEKFGVLPAWAAKRLHEASVEELHLWAKQILSSTTLEDTLR